MTDNIATSNFLDGLEQVASTRAEMANSLYHIKTAIERAETEAETRSGRLELDQSIEDLDRIGENLRQGVFRLLVLGDMKRGKSTFLNALLGEKLLPSDVNPCTAILTILRYGDSKQVKVHFNDGTPPKSIDFATFKAQYTIDPAEAKQLEQNQEQAFPNVDYAVVEYPLPLLQKGIEIIDSPGLNDTEARNELSLGYINNCHAILFVLNAMQPCTLAERRYLENYIKDRGLTVFFLINAWDRVKESLIDPDDPEELAEAESRLRQTFHATLADYCQVEGYDLYDERVFEVSALMALRRRIKDPNASLEGTGFSPFLMALNTFLTEERATSEFRQARVLSRQAYSTVQKAVERRIPLLEGDVEQLKAKINSVEPEFAKLREIRDQFQEEIRTVRNQKATAIANSFRSFVLKLGDTFETDFLRYQPDLNFLDFLSNNKREAFEAALKKAFEQYINDQLTAWTRTAEKEMELAFMELSRSASSYGTSYNEVTDRITEKLTGREAPQISGFSKDDDSPAWAKWAAGIFSLARGNIAGVAMAGAGFDWKNIILNFITVFGVGAVITGITGIVLGPIGFALLGLGVGVVQADAARKELVKAAKKELVNYLPKVADEQWQTVYNAIEECFDAYEKEVSQRINEDINSQKEELDNLVKQKESYEVNQEVEIKRLKALEEDVKTEMKQIETLYQNFIQGKR